jgi:hypothetical protein
MPLYLELGAGRFRFLVAARLVEGVGGGDGNELDCRALFGEDEASGPGVRIGLPGTVMVVDAVLGMRDLDDSRFQPFPPGTGPARKWFDAVTDQLGGVPLPRWNERVTP